MTNTVNASQTSCHTPNKNTIKEDMTVWHEIVAYLKVQSCYLNQKNIVRITVEVLCQKYNWRMPVSFEEVNREVEFVCEVLGVTSRYSAQQIKLLKMQACCAACAYAWNTKDIFSFEKLRLKSFREIWIDNYPYIKWCLDSAVGVSEQYCLQGAQIAGNVSTEAPKKLNNFTYMRVFACVITNEYFAQMNPTDWAERMEAELTELAMLLSQIRIITASKSPITNLEFAAIKQDSFRQLLSKARIR